MKAKWKKRLITLAILIPTVIVIVEFEKRIKHRLHDCEDGQCTRPDGYGLIIDPFPDVLAPAEATIGQTNNFETQFTNQIKDLNNE